QIAQSLAANRRVSRPCCTPNVRERCIDTAKREQRPSEIELRHRPAASQRDGAPETGHRTTVGFAGELGATERIPGARHCWVLDEGGAINVDRVADFALCVKV